MNQESEQHIEDMEDAENMGFKGVNSNTIQVEDNKRCSGVFHQNNGYEQTSVMQCKLYWGAHRKACCNTSVQYYEITIYGLKFIFNPSIYLSERFRLQPNLFYFSLSRTGPIFSGFKIQRWKFSLQFPAQSMKILCVCWGGAFIICFLRTGQPFHLTEPAQDRQLSHVFDLLYIQDLGHTVLTGVAITSAVHISCGIEHKPRRSILSVLSYELDLW